VPLVSNVFFFSIPASLQAVHCGSRQLELLYMCEWALLRGCSYVVSSLFHRPGGCTSTVAGRNIIPILVLLFNSNDNKCLHFLRFELPAITVFQRRRLCLYELCCGHLQQQQWPRGLFELSSRHLFQQRRKRVNVETFDLSFIMASSAPFRFSFVYS
jgi:hypothetical protein